jgi:hypothetical protein
VCDNPAIDDMGVVGYADMPLVDADGRVLGSCARSIISRGSGPTLN